MKHALPLLLLAAGVAAPASAQSSRLRAWADYSWGTFDKTYNDQTDSVLYRANGVPAQATVQRAALGATFDVLHLQNARVFLGAEVAMASAMVEPDGGAVTLESGFKPQAVSILGGVGTHYAELRGGYLLDLGNELNVKAANKVELPNSDGADAAMVGLHVHAPVDILRLNAGVEYYHTFKNSETATVTTASPGLAGTYTVTFDQDASDYLEVSGGVGFQVLRALEVGANVRYYYRTKGSLSNLVATGGAAPQQNAVLAAALTAGLSPLPGRAPAELEGYALGVIPYLVVKPASVPVALRVSASTTREYTPYGFSLAGRSFPVGRTGVTVALSYGF